MKNSCVLVGLLFCGCVVTKPPVVDINPTHVVVVAHRQSFSGAEPGLVVLPPTNLKLTWTYEQPMPVIGVGFNVETTLDIDNPVWSIYCTTNQPPVWISATNVASYFRVSSFDE